jgi:hypothetical protein
VYEYLVPVTVFVVYDVECHLFTVLTVVISVVYTGREGGNHKRAEEKE